MPNAMTPDRRRLVLEAASAALEKSRDTVAAGWSQNPYGGRTYRAARFEFEGEPWVVCAGAQVAARARLLDATASLMAFERCTNGVAILEPPKSGAPKPRPTPRYQARSRSAALAGLGIIWHTPALDQPEEADADFPLGELDAIHGELERQLRDAVEANSGLWSQSANSRQAEDRVRPMLHEILLGHDFKPDASSFPSFWRQVQTDGVWRREGRVPRSGALEVKVTEDVEAPFGQLVDDLGEVDAVWQVRLVSRQDTWTALQKLTSIDGVRTKFEAALPARSIHLYFCSKCGVYMEKPDSAKLLCGSCVRPKRSAQ